MKKEVTKTMKCKIYTCMDVLEDAHHRVHTGVQSTFKDIGGGRLAMCRDIDEALIASRKDYMSSSYLINGAAYREAIREIRSKLHIAKINNAL